MIFSAQYEKPVTWRAFLRQILSSATIYAVVAVVSAILFVIGAAAWSYPSYAVVFVAGGGFFGLLFLVRHRVSRLFDFLPHHA
jgi:hypothetical protein